MKRAVYAFILLLMTAAFVFLGSCKLENTCRELSSGVEELLKDDDIQKEKIQKLQKDFLKNEALFSLFAEGDKIDEAKRIFNTIKRLPENRRNDLRSLVFMLQLNFEESQNRQKISLFDVL